jgi:DNA-binding CsgD family transcriptional regulator
MPGFRVGAYVRQQVLERIERLAREGLDVASFLSEAGVALGRAVPSGIEATPAPTWMTLDPASLLFTCMLSEGCTMPWTAQDMVWLEYSAEMVGNRVGDVVRHHRGVQTLRQLVETDPGGAGEYVELLRSMGAAHEALVALRARDGEHWGAVYLAREPGRPEFSSEELDFLRLVAPHLAEGIRRGLLLGEASEPEEPDAPAIVVLGENLTPESYTPGAQQWLADLPVLKRGELPAAVLSVAQAALAGRDAGRGRGQPVGARVRSERRGWVMLHGQSLAGADGRRVAVTIQPASPDRITPLLIAAYGLTQREEEVTRHVLQGNSTADIAEALCISPYTVQQHLKHIFEKTSVRSRRELMGRVFTRHYQPRVEDNHERVDVDKPIRGGPFPDPSTQRVGAAHHEPV